MEVWRSWVLNHYGPEVLLREGHKVCDSIKGGMTEAEAVDMVLSDLPESSGAFQVVSAAKVGLGCRKVNGDSSPK